MKTLWPGIFFEQQRIGCEIRYLAEGGAVVEEVGASWALVQDTFQCSREGLDFIGKAVHSLMERSVCRRAIPAEL
jgi:hypothetical protein